MTCEKRPRLDEEKTPELSFEEEEKLWISGRSRSEDILSSEGLTIEPAFSWMDCFSAAKGQQDEELGGL